MSRWYGLNRNQMQDVWANSMAYHARATCHIALYRKLRIPSAILKISPYFIFLFFLNAAWALTSGGFRIDSDALVLCVTTFLNNTKRRAVYLRYQNRSCLKLTLRAYVLDEVTVSSHTQRTDVGSVNEGARRRVRRQEGSIRWSDDLPGVSKAGYS